MKTSLLLSLLVLQFAFLATSEAFQFQKLVDVQSPVGIVNAGDGSGRLFVIQQTGQIRILRNGSLVQRAFLNIGGIVSCCGEQGLLGLAFHPDYETNGFFFVDYTNTNGDIVIARYKVSSNPNVALPGSKKILLTIPHHTFGNHNGGQLAFAHDGFLYIGVGDGGSGGDPNNNAQNLSVRLGKILRIDPSHGNPYAIPAGNPFVGRPDAKPEIWAYGLRNPWRFSFDRETGDLWIGDVGQDRFEEVDLQRVTMAPGKNYGWRRMEGKHCFNPSSGCNDGTLRLPVVEYDHQSETHCSVIGGYRYRGAQIPALVGTYLYGDFCSGFLWGAKPAAGGKWVSTLLVDSDFQISSFGEDESGELYLADYNGAIYKIIP